jgi:hypothetical protein
LIDWLVFNTNSSSISAVYRGVNKFYNLISSTLTY